MMYYWGSGDWNWAAWFAMTASMVLFWGLVGWVIFSFVRQPRNDSGNATNSGNAASVLAERFARGEIDEDEFKRRRDALRSTL